MTHTSATLDPVNAALLPVIRHHLAALQGTDPLAWRIATRLASKRWGEARGLALAHRTQEFLSAVLACRPVPLAATDPLDLERRKTLTSDEATLLETVLAMRTDNTPRARTLITQLTAGRVTAAAVKTGLSLADVLDAQPSQIRRPTAPPLRAVG
jgi:hypothetical protein